MKKRAMKKYIPKNTDYCRDCRNLKYLKMTYDKMIITNKDNPKEYIEKDVKVPVYICRYTGSTTDYDSLLFDGCKTCCEKECLE